MTLLKIVDSFVEIICLLLLHFQYAILSGKEKTNYLIVCINYGEEYELNAILVKDNHRIKL